MRLIGWVLFGAFVIQTIAIGFMSDQRDEARADLRTMTGMYNGVLIGRGCEVPE